MAYTKRPRNAATAVTLRWDRGGRAEREAKGGICERPSMWLQESRNAAAVADRRRMMAEKEEEAEEAFKGVSFMGGLPLDLALEVLRRLPLRSLVQMCILSSSFNALLRAPPKTLRLCHQLPWLVTVRVGDAGPGPDLRAPKELAAYCPLLGTWFPFPPMSEGLLSAMGGSGLLQVMSGFFTADMYPCLSGLAMASAGGLMCAVVTALRPEAERLRAPPPRFGYGVDDYLSRHVFKCEDFYLLVFNVFTGASERLPPPSPASTPLEANRVFVHMFLDASAPDAYYVVLEKNDICLSRYDDLRIYSSRTGCWMVGHAASARPLPCTVGDIWKCDLFHLLCYECVTALFAYSVHSDSWLSMPTTPVGKPGCYRDHVFKWQGHVFLARAQEQKLKAGFQVSVLTAASRWSDTASWVEVARTPSGLVQPVCTAIYVEEVKFVVCGNLVCLSASYFREDVYHSIPVQPLVYDLAGGSWYLLPPPPGNKITGFGVGLLAFQPDLQATP